MTKPREKTRALIHSEPTRNDSHGPEPTLPRTPNKVRQIDYVSGGFRYTVKRGFKHWLR